jgi:hypothetical protein
VELKSEKEWTEPTFYLPLLGVSWIVLGVYSFYLEP